MNTRTKPFNTSNSNSSQRELDDIFALATAPGMSPVAVIRISGPNCFEKISPCLKNLKGNSFIWSKDLLHFKMKRSLFFDLNNNIIDDFLTAFFFSPQSYTGQNCIELYPHGSTFILQKIFETLRALGFRDAEAGEFTERAYLNGKLDLSKAEGIQALIEAQTEYQWMSARSLSSGRLHDYINELRRNLIDASAFLEALIDFPEESDVSRTHLQDVENRVGQIKTKLLELKDSFRSGKASSQGVKVVLAGKTNAGKSSLLNYLVGTERAIVSPIAGTTRDYIEENIILNGIFFRIVDTAGLRNTEDQIEAIGIDLSKKMMESADIILYMIDTNTLSNEDLEEIHKLSKNSKAILRPILSKYEPKNSVISAEVPSLNNLPEFLKLSVQENLGTSELKKMLCSLAKEIIQPNGEKAPSLRISQQRHFDEINLALASIDEFYKAIHDGKFEECLAFELQEVIRALSRIIGTVEQDEILASIFSNFCVGK